MSGHVTQVTLEHLNVQSRSGKAVADPQNALSEVLSRPCVLVTGSRAATAHGGHVAYSFAHTLATKGITVVTGGSYGIEAAAVRGALSAGGRVLVWSSGGLGSPFSPAENAALIESVLDYGGLLVSPFAHDALPNRAFFLQRVKLAASTSSVTLVVEAALRSSAMTLPEVLPPRRLLAVPGPVTSVASEGPNLLVQRGLARLVTNASEVVAAALAEHDPAQVHVEACSC